MPQVADRFGVGLTLCMLALLVSVVSGCGDSAPSAPTASVGASPGTDSTAGNDKPDTPQPNQKEVPSDPAHPVVAIETNLGVIEIELDRDKAPITVHNFLDYAVSGHYRETLFHYVEPGGLLLGGGYGRDGQPKTVSTAIRNEADNGLKNLRGTIAMSRSPNAIDSATCIFFINLVDSPGFDHRGDDDPAEFGYCVFGHVVEGREVAERISEVSTSEQQFGDDVVPSPVEAVVIKDVRVIR